MKVIVKPGMEFQHINYDEAKNGNRFVVQYIDFYDDNEPILCAVTDDSIYPLDEIILSHYMPKVDGVWINEPNEYEY